MKPLLFLIFLFSSLLILTNAQFGEIASIVGSVLGSGAGLGSAAGAAGAIGSGAAGATGALGSIGQLYQLAQTALSLTGTGVGILNQASESSWFPAAVEQAVKTNRDFQEKLLAGQPAPARPGLGGGGGLGGLGLPGMTTTSEKLGKEYGKNFETEESGEEEIDGGTTKSPSLERELEELEKEEKETQKYIGKSTIEEVDEFGRPIEKGIESSGGGGLTGPLPKPAALSSGPRVTVEIPANIKKSDIKDYEELLGKMWPGDNNGDGIGFSTDTDEENGVPKMVPQLQKLIRDLKKSNLSKTEFLEIAKQLESNHEDNIGQPRENTTPITPPKSSELGSEEQEPPPEPIKKKKTGKNFPALQRILGTREDVPIVVTAALPSPATTTPVYEWTTTPSTTTQTPLPSPTRAGFIPAFSSTHLPESHAINAIQPQRRVDSASNSATTFPNAPRAVPTVVSPRPVVKGVVQQRFYPNQPKPNPYHTAQSQAALKQQPKPPKTYTEYQREYQEYLMKYYPAYAQLQLPLHQPLQLPQLQPQQPFYQNAQAYGQRVYPVRTVATVVPTTPPSWLAHPHSMGTLLTNQQPYSQQQYFGKKK